MHEAKSSLRSC